MDEIAIPKNAIVLRYEDGRARIIAIPLVRRKRKCAKPKPRLPVVRLSLDGYPCSTWVPNYQWSLDHAHGQSIDTVVQPIALPERDRNGYYRMIKKDLKLEWQTLLGERIGTAFFNYIARMILGPLYYSDYQAWEHHLPSVLDRNVDYGAPNVYEQYQHGQRIRAYDAQGVKTVLYPACKVTKIIK